jgi:predicted dithiol-disulfide oxidoreductase (DUF899 family)
MGVAYGSDFNYDYHVSFTKDDIAKSKVSYNYRMTEASIEELPGLSEFYKDAAGDLSTPIPVTRAAPKSCSARTWCSTSHQRAAMRAVPLST